MQMTVAITEQAGGHMHSVFFARRDAVLPMPDVQPLSDCQAAAGFVISRVAVQPYLP